LADTPILAKVHHWPDRLERPVLVLGMEGWIDAGGGAGTAASVLVNALHSETLATFDSDLLLDQRARRPMMRVENGVNTGLSWPEIELRFGADPSGRGVLVLVGAEPDMRWHQFTGEVLAVGNRLGVELVVGLGAFPAPVPHTRPIRLAATASTPELAAKVGFLPATIDVPAGIHASLEQAFATAGIPAVGVWARVPHERGPARQAGRTGRAANRHLIAARCRHCHLQPDRAADRQLRGAHRHGAPSRDPA